MTVEQMARDIVTREGGYVNDPDDPGGPTKYGVTIHTMRRLGIDLDGDGDVDANDVRLLTVEQATEIFLDHYYHKPKIDKLPDPLRESVFDMQVNAGSNAVKILQKLLNGLGSGIAADGAIGPKTLAAVDRAKAILGRNGFSDAYGWERVEYYYAIARNRPASRKYAQRRDGGPGGWIVRAMEFMGEKFHAEVEAFHKKQVAQWAS